MKYLPNFKFTDMKTGTNILLLLAVAACCTLTCTR